MVRIDNNKWRTVSLNAEGTKLRLVDQTRLPNEVVWLELSEIEDVWQAIKTLAVRGPPAIGGICVFPAVSALHSTGSTATTTAGSNRPLGHGTDRNFPTTVRAGISVYSKFRTTCGKRAAFI